MEGAILWTMSMSEGQAVISSRKEIEIECENLHKENALACVAYKARSERASVVRHMAIVRRKDVVVTKSHGASQNG